MGRGLVLFLASVVATLPGVASAQVVMTGRLWEPRWPGAEEKVPHTAVRCFGTLDGPWRESCGFRTWEMEPAGWYRLAGPAGNYTLSFTAPAGYLRPIVLTNLYARAGDVLDRNVTPRHDYAVFHEAAWDGKPATDYYQTFVAHGTGVTQVGFKLAHDGVDGFGSGSQTLLLSVHRRGDGTPDTWPQVGPTMPVPKVDCGGAKSYWFSAGWNSGEVPTRPGRTYAVHLSAQTPGNTFQAFWRPDEDRAADCYRLGPQGETGFVGRDLWMVVGSDGDGLLIPYNKRVHTKYTEFAGGGQRWSQTYVAQGRSLASAILYAAVSGRQPSQNHQRLAVRVRRGGPTGRVVGVEKIAIGNANYTGDASWGTFGVNFAPGEVRLVPGETYAIEFETLENYETLHEHRDIKNHPPDPKPGFNPYRKEPGDTYEHGTAYKGGTEGVDFDLDMQVLEYQYAPHDWSHAVLPRNFLANGNFEARGLVTGEPTQSSPDAWRTFTVDPGTTFTHLADSDGDRFVRVIGGGFNNRTVDGGYVQRVAGLDRLETYRLAGRLRSSWSVDDKHACRIGYDTTGQDTDPDADTITWSTLPDVHGIFVSYISEPVRPAADAISVWLRARTTQKDDMPFKTDFDDFRLQRVNTGVPIGLELALMSFNIRYGTAADGENHWDRRKELVFDVLRRHGPDAIGLQEALRFQLDQIREALPGYGEVGVGRDDGREKGEYCPILYAAERFRVDEHGTFWLSETPDVPGSQSWDASCPRICTWARLVEIDSGKAFYLFNAHLDHVSQQARELGAELIARRIARRTHPDPVALTGDLNAGERNVAVRYLTGRWPDVPSKQGTCAPSPQLVDTFRTLYPDAADVGTWHDFKDRREGEKIDYVLVSPAAEVLEAAIVHDSRGSRYPSDHFPLTARVVLPVPPRP